MTEHQYKSPFTIDNFFETKYRVFYGWQLIITRIMENLDYKNQKAQIYKTILIFSKVPLRLIPILFLCNHYLLLFETGVSFLIDLYCWWLIYLVFCLQSLLENIVSSGEWCPNFGLLKKIITVVGVPNLEFYIYNAEVAAGGVL